MQRGKLVILAIVGVALLLSGFAWWRQYSQGWRVRQMWGGKDASLLYRAPQIELLTLGADEPSSEAEHLTVDRQRMFVMGRKDVHGTPGLIHARWCLIDDASFDWASTGDDGCRGGWQYAFRCTEKERTATLALDLTCGRAYLVERETGVKLTEPARKALAKYVADHFE
jgi:hypothetical protein